MKKPTLGVNPKDLLGVKKVSLSKVSAIAIAHEAHAMMDGARKYTAFNWRGKAIIASIYVDACKRHIDLWFDALQRCAKDSKAHHLGHARACLGILLDAEGTGNLLDDRPVGGNDALDAVYAEIQAKIMETYDELAKAATKKKRVKK